MVVVLVSMNYSLPHPIRHTSTSPLLHPSGTDNLEIIPNIFHSSEPPPDSLISELLCGLNSTSQHRIRSRKENPMPDFNDQTPLGIAKIVAHYYAWLIRYDRGRWYYWRDGQWIPGRCDVMRRCNELSRNKWNYPAISAALQELKTMVGKINGPAVCPPPKYGKKW